MKDSTEEVRKLRRQLAEAEADRTVLDMALAEWVTYAAIIRELRRATHLSDKSRTEARAWHRARMLVMLRAAADRRYRIRGSPGMNLCFERLLIASVRYRVRRGDFAHAVNRFLGRDQKGLGVEESRDG